MDRYDELIRTDVFGLPVHKLSCAHIHLTNEQACAADPDGLLDGEELFYSERHIPVPVKEGSLIPLF